MKKGCVVVLIFLVIILVGLLVAAVIVDSKYGAVMTSPEVSHETLVTPETKVRIVLKPELAKDLIIAEVRKTYDVPEMALGMALPYEIAALLSVDSENSELETTLFINEKRFGPEIARQVNAAALLSRLTQVQWAEEGTKYEKAGVISANGTTPLHSEIYDLIWEVWGKPQSMPALAIQDGHLIEIMVDNRDGGASAILGTIIALSGGNWQALKKESSIESMLSVSNIHIYADLVGNDTLKFHVRVKCNEAPFSLRALIPFILNSEEDRALKWRLSTQYGLTMTGEGEWKDSIYEGDYTISNLNVLLQ